MTDANIVSIAITLSAIAAGALFSNVRISDLAVATPRRTKPLKRERGRSAVQ
jgi:hypothetical protein